MKFIQIFPFNLCAVAAVSAEVQFKKGIRHCMSSLWNPVGRTMIRSIRLNHTKKYTKTAEDSSHVRLLYATRTAALIIVAFLISGCVTNSSAFQGFRFGGSIASNPTPVDASLLTLPRDPSGFGNTAEEANIRNALDMTSQSRFAEARRLLAQVREAQLPGSDGFRAITCSMAILALREGDLVEFRRLGRQLDRALEDRVRIDPAYVQVVSLYRIWVGADLPVNASPAMQALKGTLERKPQNDRTGS